MGFRGEALSSIAAVSQVKMLTAEQGSPSGVMIEIEGGTVKTVSDASSFPGTSLEVNHLFYNTPARLKFLKSPATEFSHIVSAVSHQAMAKPAIRFRLTHSKKTVLDLPGSSGIKERAFQIYGSELSEQLTEFSSGRDSVRVSGLVAKPAYTRSDRTHQDFYVNGRSIKNPSLTHALYEAYRGLLMRDRHPVGFIFIDLDPSLVDVNVHPAKAEVRFRNQSQIHDLVRDVVREGLRGSGMSPSAPSADSVREAVSDYLTNAEFGMRNAEFGVGHPLPLGESAGVRGFSSPTTPQASLEDSFSHSAFRTPHSALLVPLSQIHDSFIVAQSQDGMALIDQHAAHERVLFERLQDQFSAGNIAVQNLLIPVQVEINHAEKGLLSEYLPELHRLGFLVEGFGGNTFVIKAVPSLLTGADYKKLLLDILDEIRMHGHSRQMDRLRDEILSVMACHPAIKVHRKLDMREMEQLLCDLFSCRMPHTCPHGRPTVVRFSIEEIKKMFKRM
jgi:DNA mismatch repair protein MutL